MAQIPTISIGFGDYDHTRDLWTGGVTSADLELDCTVVGSPEETFSRFLQGGEWDAAEMSLAVATALRGQGDDSLVVLPVFPARAYRQSAIYVRADGPTEASELNGARIGIPVWAQTAGVFVRGLLASDHGLDLKSIRWLQAGVDSPGREEPVELDTSAFTIERIPDLSLNQLLLAGDVDAVISARPLASVGGRKGAARRLFPKFTFDEMAYAKESGIFPIMHTLVVRRSYLERHPEAAGALVEMFTEAKDRSLARALSPTVPSYPLPWAPANAERAKGLLGSDFWPYGLDSELNTKTLNTFLDYCVDQAITPHRVTIEDLFRVS